MLAERVVAVQQRVGERDAGPLLRGEHEPEVLQVGDLDQFRDTVAIHVELASLSVRVTGGG